MEIQTSKLDISNPFGQLNQRLAQAETVLQQMLPAQRRALMDAMRAAEPTPRITVTTRISRPLRIRQPLPLAWQWLVAGVRLKRRMKKQWQRQSRRLKREFRLLARQALHHHNHRRGR